jgi:tetratricopeptide (TPR) repeat protein
MDSFRYREAIACYSLLIEINPQGTQDVAYNNRGVAHWELDDYEAAMSDFQESIKHNPVNKYALYGAGEMFMLSKSYDEAKKCFERAIDLDPSYSDALEGIAKCLRSEKA